MEIATKIKKIKKISQDKYRITLQYVDGFQGVADLSSLFLDRKKPLIGEILRGNLFSKCFIESGALAWPFSSHQETFLKKFRKWVYENISK
jgi:hypothetical protein